MLNIVLNNLKELGLIRRHTKNKLIVAYSGGIDSTVLLHTLSNLRNEVDIDLYAAYVHHNWRPLPIKELPILHKTCKEWNIPLIMIESDRTLQHSEGRGREHRYNQLTALADNIDADAILTAHHADDQVETILFRMLRGTGADGLAGIHKKMLYHNHQQKKAIVARPLLDIARDKIATYAKENNLVYFDDPSNENNKFHRNLIRNEIIPVLEEHFPHLKNSLFKLGLVIEGDLQVIKDEIDQIWPTVGQYDDTEHGLYLDVTAFSRHQIPYQRRLMRRFLQEHNVEIDYQTIEEIIEFVGGEYRHNLSTGLKSLDTNYQGHERFLSLYQNKLQVICPTPKDAVNSPIIPLKLETLNLCEEYDISVEITSLIDRPSWTTHSQEKNDISEQKQKMGRADKVFNVYLDHLLFDQDGLIKEEPLKLRTRQNGDKFHKKGMDSPMRLKKLFINKKVPRFDRDQIPMIAFENKILWLKGFGLSEEIQPDESCPATHQIKIKYSANIPTEKQINEENTPVKEATGDDTNHVSIPN